MATKKTTAKKTTAKKSTAKKTTTKVAKTEGGANITKADLGSTFEDVTGGYSTSALAQSAANNLSSALNFDVNNLDSYVTDQLRRDFITDRNEIQNSMNAAANAAYDLERAKAMQDANRQENANYANANKAIGDMRRALAGSAASGANQGAANATALQALLGLGQSNAEGTTAAMQNISNVEKERASQLAQNAVDAINTANEATASMYGQATSAYGSDKSALGYRAQGAAEGLGTVGAASDTNASAERQTANTLASQERQNSASNKTNVAVANTTQKSKSTNKNTNKNKK